MTKTTKTIKSIITISTAITLGLSSGITNSADFTPWIDMNNYKVRINSQSVDIVDLFSYKELAVKETVFYATGEAFHKQLKMLDTIEIRIDKASCVNKRGEIRIVTGDIYKNFVYNYDGFTDADSLGRFLCNVGIDYLDKMEKVLRDKSDEIQM